MFAITQLRPVNFQQFEVEAIAIHLCEQLYWHRVWYSHSKRQSYSLLVNGKISAIALDLDRFIEGRGFHVV